MRVKDYDLAGLQIYAYLAKHLTPTVEFVMPTTPTQALNKLAQKSPKNSDELYQAICLANAMGAEAIAGLFKQTRRFIEQERLLCIVIILVRIMCTLFLRKHS